MLAEGSLLLHLLLFAAVAAVLPSAQVRRIAQLKSLAGRPHPVDIGGAKELHGELFRRASGIARVHGHHLSKAAGFDSTTGSTVPSAQCSAQVMELCATDVSSGDPAQSLDACQVCTGQHQHQLRQNGCTAADLQRLCASFGRSDGANIPSPLFMPAAFGADPTGQHDSTASVLAAVAALLNSSETRGARHMAAPVKDLGGATLDLLGGTYLISSPIVIPAGYGHCQITRGTLRASQTFPANRFLIEIGSDNPHNFHNATDFCYPSEHQGICNEHINLSEIFLDAQHAAAGGLSVSKTMGLTVGPSAFVYGFTDAGIRIDSGHEAMIFEAWVAEYYWDETGYANTGRAIGIELNGPDNVVTNVIVFSHTDIGMKVGYTPRSVGPAGGNETAAPEWAGCNVLDTVHIWNGGPVQVWQILA
jgi:hypothetical protein